MVSAFLNLLLTDDIMNKRSSLLFLGLIFYITSFAQDTWKIDNAHSNINFEVGWEDFSIRTGEFKIFEGDILTNSGTDLTKATYNLKVDPKSIDVIAPNLSDQLKSDQFLDADKFPEITFNSVGAKEISDSTFVTTGNLKIHGIEKKQDVLIKFEGEKQGRRSYLMGLKVSLQFNRNDFGLTWGAPRLGETVKVVGYLLYNKRIEDQ